MKFRIPSSSNGKNKKMTIVGRIGLTLFGSIFAAAGLFFCYMLIQSALAENTKSTSWVRTPCTIIESTVKRDNKSESPYRANITYEYHFNGQTHQSQEIGSSTSGHSDYRDAEEDAARYPKGSQHECLVNPANPSEAVLETQGMWMLLILPFPLIFVAIGGGLVFYAWFGQRKDKKPTVDAHGGQKLGKKGKVAITLFGLVFFCVGMGIIYGLGVLSWWEYFDARSWQQTPCVVEHASVQSHSSDDGTTYSVDILYRYEINGQTYRSNRYSFVGGSSNGHSGKQAIVKKYPVGSQQTCWVNPSDPRDSVLHRDFSWSLLLGLIGLPFAAVGGGILIWQLKSGFKSSTKKMQVTDWLPEFEGNGPLQVKPKSGRWGKVIGLIFFAVIWNGIVSIFVWQIISGYMQGNPDWFLTLFMIPFVLVGLAVVGGIFYTALAAMNPRIMLTLSNDALHPGDLFDIAWDIPTRSHRLDTLTITLEAEETTHYNVGTNRRTNTDTVFTQTVHKATDASDIRSGLASVQIPAEAMHSFDFSSNELNWRLTVKGEIGRWPDIKDEYAIVVVPAEYEIKGNDHE